MIQMMSVLAHARRLAKLDPDQRRLAYNVSNEIAGDGKRRKRRNGRKKVAVPARIGKPRRAKAAAKPALAPKAAAPRVRPKQASFMDEDEE